MASQNGLSSSEYSDVSSPTTQSESTPTFSICLENKRAVSLQQLELTIDEKLAATEFLCRVEGEHNFTITQPIICAQFVLGSNQDIDKAVKHFVSHQAFIEELKFDEISNEQVLICARKLSEFVQIGGYDEEGRLCFGVLRRLLINDDPDTEPRIFMKTLLVLLDALSTDLQFCRRGATLVTDCAEMTLQNLTMEHNRLMIRAVQEVCPIHLGRVFLLEPPMLLRGFLAVLRPFLSEIMNERIILGPADTDVFEAGLVDPEIVPPILGGKATSTSVYDIINAYVNDWA